MRECQLCGVKSWGPLQASGRALLLAAIPPEHSEVDFTAYRQCDNCGAPARTDIIEKPAPDAEFGSRVHFGGPALLDPLAEILSAPRCPDPLTLAADVMAKMTGRMPQPETRLERIVRATLQAKPAGVLNAQTAESAALEIMKFARAIEREMDKAAE